MVSVPDYLFCSRPSYSRRAITDGHGILSYHYVDCSVSNSAPKNNINVDFPPRKQFRFFFLFLAGPVSSTFDYKRENVLDVP